MYIKLVSQTRCDARGILALKNNIQNQSFIRRVLPMQSLLAIVSMSDCDAADLGRRVPAGSNSLSWPYVIS